MIGLLRSNLGIFLLRKFGAVWVFYIALPGVVIWQLGSIHLKFLSCWVESTHPFAARVVDSRPSVLIHPSGGHNCLTRCPLQMFLKPRVCVECGNRTREHQSGHQSSYWLWTSVLNFSDLTRTGVTHSPPHSTKTESSISVTQSSLIGQNK